MSAPQARNVVILGLAQTLAWGSSYYLPAVLAEPMAQGLGITPPEVFMAFSLAMLLSAAIGPSAGKAIDRFGGRPVLMLGNGVFVLGLAGLALSQNALHMTLAWCVLGLAMGAGLYEAAFATLVRLFRDQSRAPITGITLIAGFASTVGWPLSTWMAAEWGWRGACWGWVVLHVLVALPLNAGLSRATGRGVLSPDAASPHEPTETPEPVETPTPVDWRVWWGLAYAFGVAWFVSTAMAAHFPRVLQLTGLSLAAAVAMGALIGPAQVAARMLEFGFIRKAHPLVSARLAALSHPLGAAIMLLLGGPLAAVFAVLHGAGNGVLTIAKGTLPLVLMGPQAYGQRQGWLMVPARLAQASAPFVFGVCLDQWGLWALGLTMGLSLSAAWVFHRMPRHRAA
jgi:predicted MFS family arabinose efflux permease